MSQLRIAVKPHVKKLRNPEGQEGRLKKLRKTVNALIKHERIELNYPRADEARQYAERVKLANYVPQKYKYYLICSSSPKRFDTATDINRRWTRPTFGWRRSSWSISCSRCSPPVWRTVQCPTRECTRRRVNSPDSRISELFWSCEAIRTLPCCPIGPQTGT